MLVASLLCLGIAACGGGAGTGTAVDAGEPPTAEYTAESPSTEAPEQAYDGPEGAAAGSLADIAEASATIVVGTISDITEEDITPPAIRAAGDTYTKVVYELQLEDQLQGSAVPDPVLVYGYLDIQRAGDAPTTRVGVDGYRAQVGDRLLVGLAPPFPQKADLELSTPQSLFVVGDDAKAASLAATRASSSDPAVKAIGEETSGLTGEEIIDLLRSN